LGAHWRSSSLIVVERELSNVASPIIKGVVMPNWNVINYYRVRKDWTVMDNWDISEMLSSL